MACTRNRTPWTFGSAILILFLLSVGQSQAGLVTYAVTVNSTPANGIDGFLDFQFNTSGGTGAETATVKSFAHTGGTLDGTSTTAGGGSGVLPSNLTLQNTDPLNEVNQGFTPYGTDFSFTLDLSGPAVGGGSAQSTTFGLSLLASDNATPLSGFTHDGNGFILTIDINPDGSVTVKNNDTGHVTVVKQEAVPEPSALILSGMAAFALGSMGLVRYRRQARALAAA